VTEMNFAHWFSLRLSYCERCILLSTCGRNKTRILSEKTRIFSTLSCCTTMPGRIQLSKLDKKLRACFGLHWNILSTVRTYRLVITICLDH